MNGAAARRLRSCITRATASLPVPASPDQHSCIGGGDLIDQIVDAPHRRARPDQVAPPTRDRDRLAQALDLAAQCAVLAGPANRDRERLDLDRLGHEVVGPRADRTDRGLQAAERGQHDDRHVGTISDDSLADLEPAHPLHVEIGHHDIEVVIGQCRDRLRPGSKRDHGDAPLLEAECDQIDHLALVVDEEDLHAAVPRGK
jgi:hypothetical protein